MPIFFQLLLFLNFPTHSHYFSILSSLTGTLLKALKMVFLETIKTNHYPSTAKSTNKPSPSVTSTFLNTCRGGDSATSLASQPFPRGNIS